MPGTDIQVVCKPNVFDRDSAVYAEVKQGLTIAQMLGDSASHAMSVTIGGDLVPRVLWAHVKPKAGTQINIVLYPQGGSAGKWLRIIAIVVISFFTMGAGAVALAGALGVTTTTLAFIGMAAILVVNALIPPPSPKLGGAAAGDPFQQLSSITGTSNAVNPYGVIPCVVGMYRFYPCQAALPYSEISGDQQYLRMLLDLGYGDLDISDIKIGDTALSAYEDVDYQISTAPSLFTQDINELSVGTTLDDNASDTRTTQSSTEEISLDLIFSQGLFGISDKNETLKATANFTIVYANVNTPTTWVSVTGATGLQFSNGGMSAVSGAVQIQSSERKTLRCGVRWTVPTGQYTVRVTRNTTSYPGANSSGKIGGCAWSVLRSVSHSLPSTTGTLKLAIRIKATDQLQGMIQNLSVLGSQRVRTWNKTTQAFTAPAATQNPAWIYAWLLTQCPAVPRRIADARVDWDGIADWAAECDAKGYKVSFIMDSARAFSDVIRDVLACGRASFGFRNGLYSAVRDIEQTVPVQMFTPANSWGFSYSRAFADLPHALRCKFINPDANYKQDYVTVYAAGYSAANATRYEELDLGPVVDPAAAWRLGMYHMAVLYNRPTQYVFNADIENMVCERGDLITCAHDVTGWGEAWGRVVAVDDVAKTVTLDGPVTLAAGKAYRVRARTVDVNAITTDQATASVTSAAGTYTVLQLATALDAAVGDLWVLGAVNQEVADLIVRQIEPDNNMNAKLTCVDAAPAVWSADSGTPPVFVSNITGDIFCEAPPPPNIAIFESGQSMSTPDDGGITRSIASLGGGGAGGGGGTGIVRPGQPRQQIR